MKREAPNLFSALLLGLFGNILLSSQVGYWVRPGILLLPVSVAALAAVSMAFAWGWRRVGENPLIRWTLLGLLALSSAIEILRLWRLFESIYPDGMSMFGICLMIVVPVIYLRRVSSIAQTANVVLAVLLVASVFMVASIASQLRLSNLQFVPLSMEQANITLRAQIILYPEFLLAALWPDSARFGRNTLLRLAGGGVAFSVGVHLLLELFFGADVPFQENPLHTAAQSGSFSIFNRLEWLQLILWMMVVTIKLALYLYAGVHLMGGYACKSENNAVGLDRFPVYFALMLFLCALWRSADLEVLMDIRNILLVLYVVLIVAGGGLQWLLAKKSEPA